MARPSSRRTPERLAVGWSPFLLGAAVAAFAGGAVALVLANLVLGLVCAVLLASSHRSTGNLLRLLPRLAAAVLAVNILVLVALFAVDRI
jgi:cell division protein FtsX